MKELPSQNDAVEDAQPDPEPIAPSLPGPDPGIYHHETVEPEENDRA